MASSRSSGISPSEDASEQTYVDFNDWLFDQLIDLQNE
jgi:hypothetical protein